MLLADACVQVGTIPLDQALIVGSLGLLATGLIGFALGAWWARG